MEINTVTINGIKYLTSNTNVVLDYFTKKYILKNESEILAKKLTVHKTDGVLSVEEYVYTQDFAKVNDKQFVYLLKCVGGNRIIVKDYEIVSGKGILYHSLREEDENYVLYDYPMNKRYNNANKFREFNNQISAFRDMSNPDISDADKKLLIERDLFFGTRSLTYKIFEGIKYTFGIELETSSGRLSEKEAEDLNLKCEFDGSLRENPDQRKEDVLGGEYITGVLTGDSGMHQLNKVCSILSQKCAINDKCGVHVHIGSLTFTKENIVYMYMLGELLQDEIFSLLPRSRRNNSYCKKLKNLGLDVKQLRVIKNPFVYKLQIDEYFRLIFKEVYSGAEPSKNRNKNFNHPSGSKCGYNKEAQRYCWLNFVTAMCNTKNNKEAYTLEFRPHYATLNYTKIKNWLKLCVAFTSFAENHKLSIKRGYWEDSYGGKHPINLTTIVKATYPRTGKILEEYIDDRKNRFLMDNGDIELLEYAKDKEGVTNLSLKECV